MLKRKRSVSELGSSPSPSSSSASPPTGNFNFTMDVSPRVFHDAPAQHLNSRTLKRFRDSRPSDDEVHRKFYEWRAHHRESTNSCVPAERTLSLLYSAQQQQQQPHASPVQQLPTSPFPSLPQATATAANQQSLHRFWNINSAPSLASSTPGAEQPMVVAPTSCEDCGASLGGGNGDEMELDGGSGLGNTACGACGKHVCFSCSVSNLGEEKRCLQCAGRRVWVGGIGWTNAGVSVC
ncbi:hypothetical protein TOPH_04309 [Tolypocladium ophioglossoides CBS 100239]|uniref:Uncharacterized protein n=1 Tax=Tolypocladium ophioglossoides (strain CBS 100239) TaxID=1163406 RepID=A0A0L0NA82_TOLOC|nr:hypothetical protein TOPH_04309 [Tolypocladium ophioglossoides CBS 100239]